MVTSFGKIFYVSEQKADEFAKEIAREVPPTLTKDFKSQLKMGNEARLLLRNMTSSNQANENHREEV